MVLVNRTLTMNLEEKLEDISVDDDAEILALEKLLSAADDEEVKEEVEKQQVTSSAKPSSAANYQPDAPKLREDSSFAEAFSYEIPDVKKLPTSNNKEFDSSDDEEITNFLERKYNEYGCEVNKRLKEQSRSVKELIVEREVNAALTDVTQVVCNDEYKNDHHIKSPHHPIKRQSLISDSFKRLSDTKVRNEQFTTVALPQQSVFTDPVFGLRIIKPLVSSKLLVERMEGRKAISFASVAFHTQRGDLSKDWVIAGVVIHKSPVKMTKTQQPYSIWRLSDLKGEVKTISLFLFKGAHKELWKTAEGTIIAVLNPQVFDNRGENTDVACLTIDAAQKVMILGQSKDLGSCKARKRNGDVCNAVVNLSECDTCIFHIKQEFGKMSKRSELQSANAGRGLNELRNKVLGKNEVFYGGQSFSAIPAKKSSKLAQKDMQRLSSLSEYAVSPFASSVNHPAQLKNNGGDVPYVTRTGPVSKVAADVGTTRKQRLKDLERLKILEESIPSAPVKETISTTKNSIAAVETTTTTTPKPSAVTTIAKEELTTKMGGKLITSESEKLINSSLSSFNPVAPDKFKNREFSHSPRLSRENFCIEINIGERKAQLAKMKALEILKKKPIEKVNPNGTRGTAQGKRRAIDELNEKLMSNETKRQKLIEEQRENERKTRIERIMAASSSHSNLVDMRDREEEEKYFNRLEKKEALEEKMLNAYKVACKAVICQLCKYTAFSASERCKEAKHPLKVVDAEKRFFECKDCGNRTVTVFKLPKTSCKNCQGSRWKRAAMIRERKITNLGSENLSLRGDEELFIGSIAGKANLNLLVAD
uniref:Protein MCM10 homolog n=1 Tax=Glossina brevipalpis TaxID=37001 RepID=A0A1A9X0R8_9MUSC